MKLFTRTSLKGCLVIFSALLVCFLIVNWHTDEPRYQGKRLSAWMDELTAEPKNISESESLVVEARQRESFTNVVRSIGTRALPYYLDWIENQPRGNSGYEKLTDWLEQISHYRVRLPKQRDRAYEAVWAIQILGPSAKPAIVSLERLLKVDWTCGEAAPCLAAIGADSVPVLTNALVTSTNTRTRYVAARALGDIGAVAKPAKFALLEAVQKEKSSSLQISTADLALRALVEIDSTSDELLPLLAKELSATNAAAGAAYGLARLGAPGMPFLMPALTNQNARIRASAEAALELRKHLETKRQPASPAFDYFNVVYNSRLLRESISPP